MGHPTSPFLDDHVRAGAGERVAIESPGTTVTYAELTDVANRTGNALRDMGVEPEQRVAVLLPDGVDWAATFFGALRMLTDARVTDAGVVGAEVAGGLVKPFCFVVARRDGAEGLVDDLTRLAGDRLAPHQRPRRIVVVSELPRTATGKLQRFRLREMVVEEGTASPGTPSVGGCGGPFRGPTP